MPNSEWKRKIHERDGFQCKRCGSKFNLSVHHCVARCHGGTNCESNCTTLCSLCHREYHRRWGVRTSDMYGNPIGELGGYYKKRKKKHKHRR